MRRTFLTVAATLLLGSLPFVSFAASVADDGAFRIIPMPREMTSVQGQFQLTPSTQFVVKGKDAKVVASFFAAKIKAATGYDIKIGTKSGKGNIELSIAKVEGGNEAYTLDVSDRVVAKATTAQGLFYAMQSFMQLLPPQIENATPQSGIQWTAPAVKISDAPRYGYRGIMLDVCRHFMPIEVIKHQIDVLALFKINNLHWHLTDDQGWRIEIKKYPELTQYGAWRTEGDGSRHGGYYTQEQIKEVVAYAKERFINIVPELELPGHGLAAIAAYPQLSCKGDSITPRIIWGVEDIVMCPGKELTFTFLENVIKEMVKLFPGKYFHIGGDESPRVEWEKCPLCQKRISDLGYVSEKGRSKEAQLQSYVVGRIEKVLNKYGKSIIGWDEILEGGNLNPSAIIMSWRGEQGGIAGAKAGHEVIMTPSSHALYLDAFQDESKVEQVAIGGFSPLQRTYAYDPTPEQLVKEGKEKYIKGVQGNVWGEYLLDGKMVEYRLYPRALAVAEIGWSQTNRKDFEQFARKVDTDAALRLAAHDINFHIPLPRQKGGSSNFVAFTDQVSQEFITTRPEKMVYTTDGTEPTLQSTVYTKPLVFTRNTELKIATVLPCGLMSPTRTIRYEKQALSPAVSVKDTLPGLHLMVADGKFMNTAELAHVGQWKHKTITNLREIRSQAPVPSNVRNVNHYASVAYGYINIPEDGVYTFTSDNAEVWVDGEKIVDNDKCLVKRFSRNDGSRALSRGLHAFRVVFLGHIGGGWPTYWNDGSVHFRRAGEEKFQPIGAGMLYR